MLTAAEAKTKWCPMARAGDNGNDPKFSVNRTLDNKPDQDCMCLASGCMAWRTAGPRPKKYFIAYNGKPEEEWNWDPTNHKGYEDAKVRVVEPEAYGYCGLAGKADPA